MDEGNTSLLNGRRLDAVTVVPPPALAGSPRGERQV